jgi:hypothetical protein
LRCRRGAGPRGRRRGCTGEPRRSGGSREAWLESAPARPRDGQPARPPAECRSDTTERTRAPGAGRTPDPPFESASVRCIASRRGHSAATQVTTSTGPDLRPDTRIGINTQVRTVARADMSTPQRPASQARAPRLTALSRTSTVACIHDAAGLVWYWHGIGMVLAWYEPHSLCIAISLIGIAARCRVC